MNTDECKDCNGTGKGHWEGNPFEGFWTPCETCNGFGTVEDVQTYAEEIADMGREDF